MFVISFLIKSSLALEIMLELCSIKTKNRNYLKTLKILLLYINSVKKKFYQILFIFYKYILRRYILIISSIYFLGYLSKDKI